MNQEILELHIKILRNFFKIRPREIHVYSDGSGAHILDILEELKIVEQTIYNFNPILFGKAETHEGGQYHHTLNLIIAGSKRIFSYK